MLGFAANSKQLRAGGWGFLLMMVVSLVLLGYLSYVFWVITIRGA